MLFLNYSSVKCTVPVYVFFNIHIFNFEVNSTNSNTKAKYKLLKHEDEDITSSEMCKNNMLRSLIMLVWKLA